MFGPKEAPMSFEPGGAFILGLVGVLMSSLGCGMSVYKVVANLHHG